VACELAGKPKYSEKTCPSVILSTTNPMWSDPGSNPGRRGGKPATNRLRYGSTTRPLPINFFLTNRQSLSYSRYSNVLWNPKVHYHVNNSHALVPTLSQLNPVNTTPPDLSNFEISLQTYSNVVFVLMQFIQRTIRNKGIYASGWTPPTNRNMIKFVCNVSAGESCLEKATSQTKKR
jgi:hypothetical protein